MRYHRAFGELARLVGTPPSERLGVQQLVAARLEPVMRAGAGAAVVDLHFRAGDARTIVPLVIVDVSMLEARERDVLVWPAFARELSIDFDGVGDRIETWLRELAVGPLCEERHEIFGDSADEDVFRAARDAELLGAAPLEAIARRASPFIFARRHAVARDVVIASRNAELGALLLAPLARRVHIRHHDDAAAKWYGPANDSADVDTNDVGLGDVLIVDASTRDRFDAAEARIVIDLDADSRHPLHVQAAPAVALDQLFDFTGTVMRNEPAFSVRARTQRQLPSPLIADRPAVGGSTGRVVFGLRAGALRLGGGDVDLARAIAQAMRDEGFTVEVVDDAPTAGALRPDLVHAFGCADSTIVADYLKVARTLDVPFAFHPLYDAAAMGGYWGATVTPYCYRFMHDEATVASLCALMRERRLAVNAITAGTPFHPTQPRWIDVMRYVTSQADAVFVAGPAEIAKLRELGVDREFVTVAPPVGPAPDAAPIAPLVGMEGYALLHAPLESTQNQLQAVRAAALADIPLVVAGPVADADYASLVRSFAGERTMLVGEPSPPVLEALYRGAELFIDVAWVGCGFARAARALSRGAALVLSNRMPVDDLRLDEFARAVDPGDAENIARGLGDTWTIRQNEAASFEEVRRAVLLGWGVRDVTTLVIAAYAQALERRNQPVMR